MKKILKFFLIAFYVLFCSIPLFFINIGISVILADYVETEITTFSVFCLELIIIILVLKFVTLDRYKLLLIAFILYEIFFVAAAVLLKDLEYMEFPNFDRFSFLMQLLFLIFLPVFLIVYVVIAFLYLIKIGLPYLIIANTAFIAITLFLYIKKRHQIKWKNA